MTCPKCGADAMKVVDTRGEDGTVRRRRECLLCLYRFTSYEISETNMAKYERAVRKMHRMEREIQEIIKDFGG